MAGEADASIGNEAESRDMATSSAYDSRQPLPDQRQLEGDKGDQDSQSDELEHKKKDPDPYVVDKKGEAQIEQQYEITREKDDLVISVWKGPDNEVFDWRNLPQDSRTIALQIGDGPYYCIPYMLTVKWKWLKAIIKLICGNDEAKNQEVDDEKFVLYCHGEIILRELYDRTIRAGNYHFKVAFDSGKPVSDNDETTSNDSKKENSAHQLKIKYRIDLFQKSPFAMGKEDFLISYAYDQPQDLDRNKSRGQKIPVLEEINHIVLGSKKSQKVHVGRPGDPDKDPPKEIVIDVGDDLKPKKLHLRSQMLLNALRSIVKYTSTPFSSDKNESSFADGLFSFPFMDLYHHRQELLELKDNTSGPRANHTKEYNDECDAHIDILIDYLDREPTIQLKSIQEKWGKKIPTTTFPGFWVLIKPGSDVYVRENGQLNAFVVDQINGGIDYSPLSFVARSYSIRVWNLIYDGKDIKRRERIVKVPVFDGERDITSLPLFPTHFHDRLDDGTLRKKLVDRGHMFYKLTKGPKFLEFTGTGLKQGWRKYNRARVVVEHHSLPWLSSEFASNPNWRLSPLYDSGPERRPPPILDQTDFGLGERARAPRCECLRCRTVDHDKGVSISTTFADYDSIEPGQEEGLTEHQALISMSHMYGFVLKDRAYDILDLTGLTEPMLAENAIDELVLRPESNKTAIKAIARTYTESDSQADLFSFDFIRGKGEGQIFLLHGPPGTGKTLTAESVAEYTKRPLLNITAADLGHEADKLERNLLKFFKNASAWDAIVLLDEADVYLEQRTPQDLSRNSIVSIFLRALDYFEGILFFTTNRVGHFDEAFLSRIHVAIDYDPLDDEARGQIWDALFRKLKTNHKNGGPKIDYEYDAKEYVRKSADVQKLQWNGREIRNAFQTAVALAIADAKTAREKGAPAEECVPQITEAHLSQVVSMSAAFKRYITATHEGVDEQDRAMMLGNRYDRLKSESK